MTNLALIGLVALIYHFGKKHEAKIIKK